MDNLGINHAPYVIDVEYHDGSRGVVEVNSEWCHDGRPGHIFYITGLGCKLKGWHVKHFFRMAKALGWTTKQRPREHWISRRWKEAHTAPKVRAPYGSKKR